MKSPEIKFDINTVKELLKKLSFLKNNLALLVPIIIVIVAGLLFIPTRLLSARLKNTITQDSVKTATEIDKLIPEVRESGRAEAMEAYTNAYAQDANQIENMMAQTTMRELLTYDLFPDTNETSPLLFEPVHRDFLAGVDAMMERLGAGDPPADEEIRKALEQSATRQMLGRRMGMGAYGGGGLYGGGAGGGVMSGYRMMSDVDRKIIDKLCEDRARGLRIYASPADVDGYSFWTDWKYENWNTAVRQCWYWQLGYWAIQDVVDTVEKMNSSGTCVLDSPVKRLMDITFTLTRQSTRMVGRRRGRATTARRATDKQTPSYVINLKTALAAPPCTGRFCNEDADVMHFNLSVIVEADQVMPFIQELCSAKTHKFRGWYGKDPEQTFKHNQITVLESNIIPIDLEGNDHNSCRYGPGAVVQLDLICEYLFVNKGYDAVKPKVIRNDLQGVADDAAAN